MAPVCKNGRAACKRTKERYSWKIAKVAELLYLSTKMDKAGNKRVKKNARKAVKPAYWYTNVAVEKVRQVEAQPLSWAAMVGTVRKY